MTHTERDPWTTCPECAAAGLTHATLTELQTDPIGTWRKTWRDSGLAIRWYDHPSDAQPSPGHDPYQPVWSKAWAHFGPWGVDEIGHNAMAESERITTTKAMEWFHEHSPTSHPTRGTVPEVSVTSCRDWSHGPAVVRLAR